MLIAALAALLLTQAEAPPPAAPPAQEPVIETPPPEAVPAATPAPETPAVPEVDPLRGLQEQRFALAAKTSIGGYGEMHYNYVKPEEGDAEGEIDFHRFVVFLAHNFSEKIRFYGELEVEHAFVSRSGPGEVGIEQAFVDWRLLDDALVLRAGIVLVPMGIINQWHEPPIFNGVERPLVDRRIIPSTWREGGLGVTGELMEMVRYEAYLVGGLNPLGFSLGNGLRGGRQHIAEAKADAWALTGRVEVEPILGVVIGASGYGGDAGPNVGEFLDAAGEEQTYEQGVPVLAGALDARARLHGLEARGVVAVVDIGGTNRLRSASQEAGEPGPNVGERLLGYYLELGYDVFELIDCDEQLVPFVRYEISDTANAVQGRARTAADEAQRIQDIVFGVSYRPIAQLAFKADVILREPGGDAAKSTLVNAGVGFMF